MKQINLHPKLLIAVTEKSDGNVDERFSPKKIIKTNRTKIFKELNLKAEDIIEAQQIHSSRILPLNAENSKMWKGNNVTGIDGFITDQDSIALMLRLADCVPVVIFDPINTALGVFHAGWRGTQKGIHTEGVKMLNKFYESDPKQLLTWIGPSAQKDNYITQDEPEQKDDTNWQPYIVKTDTGWSIDLPGYIADTLTKMGILKKNITFSKESTIESENYFSHVRSKTSDEPEGRFAVIAKIK
jgi:polyphenol oxidase